MEENTTISIKGNETIEELVKKVNKLDSIESKITLCQMIIHFLEIKNSVKTGTYSTTISLTKKYPPKKDPIFEFEFDINLFLFLLKETDMDCYLKIQNIHEKIDNKNRFIGILKVVGFIVGIIVLIYLTSSYFDSKYTY